MRVSFFLCLFYYLVVRHRYGERRRGLGLEMSRWTILKICRVKGEGTVSNTRIRELCEVTKEKDERINESVLQGFLDLLKEWRVIKFLKVYM